MKLLLDSNVLLWALSDSGRLTPRVRDLLQKEDTSLLVSLASIWELSIKIANGKLSVPGGSVGSILDELEASNVQVLPITRTHILRTETLPHHHRDPFDRLIIAQALEESLTIASADASFIHYGVSIIWK